jgi:hypothetical protein
MNNHRIGDYIGTRRGCKEKNNQRKGHGNMPLRDSTRQLQSIGNITCPFEKKHLP